MVSPWFIPKAQEAGLLLKVNVSEEW